MCLNGQLCHQQVGIDNLQDFIAGNLSLDPAFITEVRGGEGTGGVSRQREGRSLKGRANSG